MTTMDDRFAPAHMVQVVRDDRTYGLGCRAECSCGWAGAWHDEAGLADAAAEDHREIAIDPGDGLDRLMGELLDLQDDLAQAVMWLAEHWSADLPAPYAYGYGSDPVGVRLLAYCGSGDVLTRAVAVLGMPLADDPAPDTQGVRYRRAVRRFGVVALHVYREIAPACGECGTALAGEQCPTCGERAGARRVTLGVA